jgi:hypothetical protein
MVRARRRQCSDHWLQPEGETVTHLGSDAESSVENRCSNHITDDNGDAGADGHTVAHSHTYAHSYTYPVGRHRKRTTDPIGRI